MGVYDWLSWEGLAFVLHVSVFVCMIACFFRDGESDCDCGTLTSPLRRLFWESSSHIHLI
jgi:hypothetical protein